MHEVLLTRAKTEEESQKPRRLPWVLAGMAVALTTLAVGLDQLVAKAGASGDGGSLFEALTFYFLFVSFPLFGAFVLARMPGNNLGRLFVGMGLLGGIGFLGQTYAQIGLVIQPGRWPFAEVGAWVEQWWWYPMIVCLVCFLPLLFPDGYAPSPRWRVVGWISAVGVGAMAVGGMFERRLQGQGYSVDNPIGIDAISNIEEMGLFAPVALVLATCSLLAVVSLIVRYRRAQREQRQQLKWFIFAITLMVVGSIGGDALELPEILFPIFLATLMGSIAIAVLKYRLYDIDVIINRTLVYGLLTAALLGSYLLIVFGLSRLIDPVTQDSDVAIAASTLAVAAMFRPLRARIQAFIDRRFYRAKYDAERSLNEFSLRLREEVDIDLVQSDVLTVVRDTVQPSHASVLLIGSEQPAR
ncbi:MAG: hypothetical protein ABR505_02990 [Actinomycetota bacterium]